MSAISPVVLGFPGIDEAVVGGLVQFSPTLGSHSTGMMRNPVSMRAVQYRVAVWVVVIIRHVLRTEYGFRKKGRDVACVGSLKYDGR